MHHSRMTDDLLMIFVKNPQQGRVKTRLARTVGDANALTIYRHLLEHTRAVTTILAQDKAVHYSETIEADDLWPEDRYHKQQQVGNDLGERISGAFQGAFDAGYQRVVIIGSDTVELTTAILEAAFRQLQHHNLVVGPARDGGYYLLGMDGMYAALFQDITWSTAAVLPQTLLAAEKQQLSVAQLPTLSDIDVEEDLGRPAAVDSLIGRQHKKG
ncbi:MAG: TIGR04282 family arsenosugar biosynthesis glycosyltransferase [Bacteroidota bacterium]